ncbi:MAG: ComEC/Rec2 family competence protein [Nitratireductor sp.]
MQVSSLAFTSIVAGIATGLFATWHFHRIAPMGFVANLAAMPVVSFLVMPLALLSSLLMPYGLEFLTLDALGWSIRRVVEISNWTNSFWLFPALQVPNPWHSSPLAQLDWPA